LLSVGQFALVEGLADELFLDLDQLHLLLLEVFLVDDHVLLHEIEEPGHVLVRRHSADVAAVVVLLHLILDDLVRVVVLQVVDDADVVEELAIFTDVAVPALAVLDEVVPEFGVLSLKFVFGKLLDGEVS
jgi:hypothetical protein